MLKCDAVDRSMNDDNAHQEALLLCFGMNVILALDVGSSSARCSAYQLVKDAETDMMTLEALDECHAQRKLRSVEPNTGNVILNGQTEEGESYNLLDEIDACIDTTLQALRECHDEESFQVVGLGFSTFVMNLIGVDDQGNPVGEKATISYACNSPAVAEECRNLKRFVRTVCLCPRLSSVGTVVSFASLTCYSM